MDKVLSGVLKSLGLSSKEIRFFEISFALGPSSINEVARKARLQRSTAYLVTQSLISRGLIQEGLHRYGKKISTVEPKTLLRLVSGKQRQLRRQEIELEERLPELEASYSISEIKPKAKVYEGNQGLLSIFNNILESKGEILLWTNQETETAFFNNSIHDKFIKIRVSKEIQIRVLAVDNEHSKKLLPLDKKVLRKTKLLPKGKIFSAETYVYDNKVAIIDFKKDILGVMIESQPIADAQRTIFNTTWDLL